jgi:hypothetical protein
MTRRATPSRSEAAWLLLCAGILTWKLLLPGFIGMADNGDFAKIAGPLSLGNAEPAQGSILHAVYLRDYRYYYNPHVPSSERLLAWAASTLEQTFGDPTRFDIRWLGVIHGLIFLAFYYSVLIFLRPFSTLTQCVLSLVALWIFADIGLVAYLNSFYSDVPAALFGLAAVFIGAGLLTAKRPALSTLVFFTLAAFLFITSKAQHAVLGFLPAGAAFLCGWRASDKCRRVAGYLAGVALFAATAWILVSTPEWYKAESRFNLIFLKLLSHSPSPARDIEDLGLVPDDARHIGLHSYAPGGPMQEPAWADGFRTRTSYGQVLKFYVRHPSRAVAILRSDLEGETSQRYSPGLSSFQKQLDGPECSAAQLGGPECSPASSLGSWSALRSWACRVWPAHLVLWFGVLLPAALLFGLPRGTARRHQALAWSMLAVGVMAVVEFAVASLADASETARHLFIFHVFTDASIFFTLIAAAGALETACPASLRRPAAAAVACATVIFAAAIIKAELIPAARPAARNLTPISGMVDGASSAVAYAGIWRAGVFRQASGGTLTYSDRPGATARICFEGTELQYVYTKASNRGLAEVTIDGMPHSVDLYDPGVIWQARTVFGGLKPGRHCAVVRVLGRHTAVSNGNFIDVDAFVGR